MMVIYILNLGTQSNFHILIVPKICVKNTNLFKFKFQVYFVIMSKSIQTIVSLLSVEVLSERLFCNFILYSNSLFYKQCSLPEFSSISSGLKTWESKISSLICKSYKLWHQFCWKMRVFFNFLFSSRVAFYF